ncbi:MAG: ornithine carbamoyltransferase [Pseudomonadota bacterium]|nr:ornithine carbamoyltransferase [Pseudomonadota bacterium]MDE3038047.1 ornithine carbamoyltransferase [Pseudomonadota bacterium]
MCRKRCGLCVTYARRLKTMIRHFLDLSDIDAVSLRLILDKAAALKAARAAGKPTPLLAGQKLAMIFEKNSTRTRVSFEVAIVELGGHALYLSGNDLQLGRGETVADTARVLSRYVDAILLRCHDHAKLKELAENATVPVINGLTEFSHPCQILADILTFEEHRGGIKGKTIAWVGDGNNVAQSYIQAAALFGFTLRIACPQRLGPLPEVVAWAKDRGGHVDILDSPQAAVENADAVVTDTWVSMGDPDGQVQARLLAPYQVNAALMALASPKAVFLHCLPAHRGEEVTAEVIDGAQSVVFDEAENRLHVQKSILLWCLSII